MGEWQKIFVRKLVDSGLSHDHAMIAMGLACDERMASHMVGYGRGFKKVEIAEMLGLNNRSLNIKIVKVAKKVGKYFCQ